MKKILEIAEKIKMSRELMDFRCSNFLNEESFDRVSEFFLNGRIEPYSGKGNPLFRFIAMGETPREIPVFSSAYAKHQSDSFKIQGFDPKFKEDPERMGLFRHFIAKAESLGVDIYLCGEEIAEKNLQDISL